MKISSQDLKKQIINVVLEFSLQLETHKRSGEYSLTEISEMLAMALEIGNLINSLDKSDPNVQKPELNLEELRKMKRVLELVFKYKSDLNSVSIDIGENLASTNRYLQKGIDYIFQNLSRKDFRHTPKTPTNKAKSTTTNTTQVRSNKPTPAVSPKKKSLGLIAPLMFLGMLVLISMTIYNFFFNNSNGNLTSLVHEYRSDARLAQEAAPSTTQNLKVQGTFSLLASLKNNKDFFTSRFPKIKLNIESQDSSDAIRDLIAGNIDLAASSRIPTISERKQAIQAGRGLIEHKIALDSVVVFTHKSNPINKISIEDLKRIYQSDILTWKDLNPQNPSTTTISRFLLSKTSGTFAFFVDRVMLGDNVSSKIIHIYDPIQMIDLVSQNPNAIGISSLSAVLETDAVNKTPGIKVLKISSTLNEIGSKPVTDDGLIDAAVIQHGEYPLTRYLYLISAGELMANAANFIDYARSQEIQNKLEQYGLVGIQ